MQEVLTEEQLNEKVLKRIYEHIIIRRSMICKRNVAPKGYIFYEIGFTTDKNEKYTGTRLIDIKREDKIGREQIELNIRNQIAAKHWPLEFKLAIRNGDEPEEGDNQ